MTQFLIAVLDDDDHVRDATASLLRSAGHRTRVFASVAAFSAHDAREIACIVSDYRMPGRSGLELLEELRARACTVPFILVTAFLSEPLRRRALASGALAVLDKPLDEVRLLALLETALNGPAPQG
ncbi:response regulator (plasmid) [Paroceanicella profunda]|uniref:Response regulator n=1 Tax=Paroceanicella profunda TaxID=2579971 RepID=A0A5B8G4X7_9RHOB|nr:response regulator [Paroceanicella profunda]QDL94332.1 response regulator [Paroceanicella profunda]